VPRALLVGISDWAKRSVLTVPADIDEAAESIPAQLKAGYTTICFKPSQYTDDPAEVGPLCRRLVDRAASLTATVGG